jgi:hypothetical protein
VSCLLAVESASAGPLDPHPRTTRRTHPGEPPRPPRHALRRARRRDRTQPPTRPSQRQPRFLHRLIPWHYSSRSWQARTSSSGRLAPEEGGAILSSRRGWSRSATCSCHGSPAFPTAARARHLDEQVDGGQASAPCRASRLGGTLSRFCRSVQRPARGPTSSEHRSASGGGRAGELAPSRRQCGRTGGGAVEGPKRSPGQARFRALLGRFAAARCSGWRRAGGVSGSSAVGRALDHA